MKYESLAELIEPFIHLSLNALPCAVRKRVNEELFLSMFWDSRPDQRRLLANQYDQQHDPKFRREREYFFALSCQLQDTESKKLKWELWAPQNITEEDTKEQKLSALTAQLDALQKQIDAPYSEASDAAPEPQATTPSPSPVVAVGASGENEPWKEQARARAYEIIKRDKAKDLYPSQVDIADEIAKQFRKDGLTGADGKPLAGAYIKRHALNGISSAQSKLVSTVMRQSK